MAVKNYANYFVNCRGVFQGGGCKAIAFIGAYRRALECGIGFSEFAGTSAGSIIAAFASAGATPDEMEDFILNFERSSMKSDTHDAKDKYLSKYTERKGLQFFIHKVCKKANIKLDKKENIANAVLVAAENLGVYNADFLGEQIDKFLRKKLNKQSEVRFSDLKYPLKIVAADSIKHEVKIFDSKTDAGSLPVAKAVQRSCTFPFVFRPEEGRYVDGGVLSNLPIIVFPEKSGSFERTIAFTLKYVDEEAASKDGIGKYVSDIVNTITEGATKLQMKERKKFVTIEIPTYVDLFEFNELNKNSLKYKRSIQSGSDAVDDFLKQELRKFFVSSDFQKDSFTNAEQIYNQVIYYVKQRPEELVVSTKTLKWQWGLFVPLMYLLRHGSKVSVYRDATGSNDNVEQARIRTLCHMGVDVSVCQQGHVPAYGFFFRLKDDSWRGVSISYSGPTSIFGMLRTSVTDQYTVKALVECIKTHGVYKLMPAIGQPTLNIKQLTNVNPFVKSLKTRDVYRNAIFTEEYVSIKDMLFFNNKVHGYKYRSMAMLDEMMDTIPYYELSSVEFANNQESLMCPILLDKIEGKYYLVEGHVRTLYRWRHGDKTLKCLVSIGSRRFPKGDIYRIDDLFISDSNFEIGTIEALRAHASKKEATRDIENALRPVKSYLVNSKPTP